MPRAEAIFLFRAKLCFTLPHFLLLYNAQIRSVLESRINKWDVASFISRSLLGRVRCKAVWMIGDASRAPTLESGVYWIVPFSSLLLWLLFFWVCFVSSYAFDVRHRSSNLHQIFYPQLLHLTLSVFLFLQKCQAVECYTSVCFSAHQCSLSTLDDSQQTGSYMNVSHLHYVLRLPSLFLMF